MQTRQSLKTALELFDKKIAAQEEILSLDLLANPQSESKINQSREFQARAVLYHTLAQREQIALRAWDNLFKAAFELIQSQLLNDQPEAAAETLNLLMEYPCPALPKEYGLTQLPALIDVAEMANEYPLKQRMLWQIFYLFSLNNEQLAISDIQSLVRSLNQLIVTQGQPVNTGENENGVLVAAVRTLVDSLRAQLNISTWVLLNSLEHYIYAHGDIQRIRLRKSFTFESKQQDGSEYTPRAELGEVASLWVTRGLICHKEGDLVGELASFKAAADQQKVDELQESLNISGYHAIQYLAKTDPPWEWALPSLLASPHCEAIASLPSNIDKKELLSVLVYKVKGISTSARRDYLMNLLSGKKIFSSVSLEQRFQIFFLFLQPLKGNTDGNMPSAQELNIFVAMVLTLSEQTENNLSTQMCEEFIKRITHPNFQKVLSEQPSNLMHRTPLRQLLEKVEDQTLRQCATWFIYVNPNTFWGQLFKNDIKVTSLPGEAKRRHQRMMIWRNEILVAPAPIQGLEMVDDAVIARTKALDRQVGIKLATIKFPRFFEEAKGVGLLAAAKNLSQQSIVDLIHTDRKQFVEKFNTWLGAGPTVKEIKPYKQHIIDVIRSLGNEECAQQACWQIVAELKPYSDLFDHKDRQQIADILELIMVDQPVAMPAKAKAKMSDILARNSYLQDKDEICYAVHGSHRLSR